VLRALQRRLQVWGDVAAVAGLCRDLTAVWHPRADAEEGDDGEPPHEAGGTAQLLQEEDAAGPSGAARKRGRVKGAQAPQGGGRWQRRRLDPYLGLLPPALPDGAFAGLFEAACAAVAAAREAQRPPTSAGAAAAADGGEGSGPAAKPPAMGLYGPAQLPRPPLLSVEALMRAATATVEAPPRGGRPGRAGAGGGRGAQAEATAGAAAPHGAAASASSGDDGRGAGAQSWLGVVWSDDALRVLRLAAEQAASGALEVALGTMEET
jgi:hypothetical protein